MTMGALDWLNVLDVVSVGVVVVSTVYVMQNLLLRAHHLLRLGLALVCAGSVLELYGSLQAIEPRPAFDLAMSTIENVGQAAVYVWVATSKRLWRLMELTTNGE